MTDKTFTHAGVSTLNGETKVRYANDAMRVKVLAKGGHTDINLIDLGEALSKEAAVLKLIEIKFGQGNAAVEQALEAEISKRTPSEKPAKAVSKTAKKAATPITLDKIAAKKVKAKTAPKVDADLEDAPY
jgi:hypothetical protein